MATRWHLDRSKVSRLLCRSSFPQTLLLYSFTVPTYNVKRCVLWLSLSFSNVHFTLPCTAEFFSSLFFYVFLRFPFDKLFPCFFSVSRFVCPSFSSRSASFRPRPTDDIPDVANCYDSLVASRRCSLELRGFGSNYKDGAGRYKGLPLMGSTWASELNTQSSKFMRSSSLNNK